MRGFVALFRKEWRDLRAMTWVYAAVVVVACFAVRVSLTAFAVKNADPNWLRFLEPFVPAAALLFAAMAAADAVGGETASRRIDQLVLLPVRPMTVWTAKLCAVATAVFVVLSWSVLVQIGVLAAIDGRAHVERFLEFAGRCAVVPLAVAGFTAATLLVSTLRLRGIGAVVGSVVLAAGLVAGAKWWEALVGFGQPAWMRNSQGFTVLGDETVLLTLVGVALLIASALAFAKGRIHLSVVRPAAVALAVLAALVVAPATVYAAARLRVDPEGPATQIQWVAPSPDGRHVALWFVRATGGAQRSRAYVVDVATGALRELPREQFRIRPYETDGVWDADGSLVTQDFTRSRVERDWLDPDTLAVRRSQSITFHELAAEDRGPAAEWRRTHAWMSLGSSRRPDSAPATDPPLVGRVQRSAGNHEVVNVPSWIPPVMQYGTDRLVYAPEPDTLAVKTVPDGAPHVFLRAPKPLVREDLGPVSFDGKVVLVRVGDVWKAVSTETGAVTDVPGADTGDRPIWWFVQGDRDRKLVAIVRKDAPVDLIDVTSGARARFDAYHGNLHAMPGGAILRWRGKQLDLHDCDLKFVRTVWSVPAEGSAK